MRRRDRVVLLFNAIMAWVGAWSVGAAIGDTVTQYLVNSDGVENNNYGGGCDVMIRVLATEYQVMGVDPEGAADELGGWSRVTGRWEVYDDERELIAHGRLPRGVLVLPRFDANFDGRVDLHDVAAFMVAFEGPS